MQAVFDLSVLHNDSTHLDIRRACGPRFNTFAAERTEHPGQFFNRAVWKSITKTVIRDEESERWDGME